MRIEFTTHTHTHKSNGIENDSEWVGACGWKPQHSKRRLEITGCTCYPGTVVPDLTHECQHAENSGLCTRSFNYLFKVLYDMHSTHTHMNFGCILYARKCALLFQLIIAKPLSLPRSLSLRKGRWCIQIENSFYHADTLICTVYDTAIAFNMHAKCAIDIKSNARILWSMAEWRFETAVVHFRKLNNVYSVAHTRYIAYTDISKNRNNKKTIDWVDDEGRRGKMTKEFGWQCKIPHTNLLKTDKCNNTNKNQNII